MSALEPVIKCYIQGQEQNEKEGMEYINRTSIKNYNRIEHKNDSKINETHYCKLFYNGIPVIPAPGKPLAHFSIYHDQNNYSCCYPEGAGSNSWEDLGKDYRQKRNQDNFFS